MDIRPRMSILSAHLVSLMAQAGELNYIYSNDKCT